MKAETLYRIHTRSGRLCVAKDDYRWVTRKDAGRFTISEVRESIAHILSIAPDPELARRDLVVRPLTGGTKSRWKVGLA